MPVSYKDKFFSVLDVHTLIDKWFLLLLHELAS